VRIQTGPVYPYLVGTLPTPSALPATPPAPLAPTNQAAFAISPILGGPKVHVFSPTTASQSPSTGKLVDGFRALSDLITPHCGQNVAVAASAIWLGVDAASAVRTFRDPQSSAADRLVEAGAVGSDAFALLGGILGSPHLDQAANAINFAAVVGDHVHTGQITFSQSELVELSSLPQADYISNLLKLTQVLQPPGTS
jgi:hypothetical protein